jgi:hypothetical protein
MNSSLLESSEKSVPFGDITQTPISQTPVSQTPVSQTPVSQTPVSQTPVSQTQTPKSNVLDLNKFIDTNLTPGMKGCPPCDQATTGRYIYSVFPSIMALVAIYLAFRCNKGFSLGSFLIACTCPALSSIHAPNSRPCRKGRENRAKA